MVEGHAHQGRRSEYDQVDIYDYSVTDDDGGEDIEYHYVDEYHDNPMDPYPYELGNDGPYGYAPQGYDEPRREASQQSRGHYGRYFPNTRSTRSSTREVAHPRRNIRGYASDPYYSSGSSARRRDYEAMKWPRPPSIRAERRVQNDIPMQKVGPGGSHEYEYEEYEEYNPAYAGNEESFFQ